MISGLDGILKSVCADTIEIDVNGVTYEVVAKPLGHSLEGDTVSYVIWHVINERGQTLYGFSSREAKNLAILCATADGVGPLLASKIVQSREDSNEIAALIYAGDPKPLSDLVSGLGRTKAQNLIDKLRTKVQPAPVNHEVSTVQKGVLALGYTATPELLRVITEECSKQGSTSEKIRNVLARL
jgi:Holliday junction DNA helicase RuvA